MHNPTARIRLLKNLLLGGKAHAAGTVVSVDIEDALACVEMQKAVIVDADARARALEVRREAIRKMLRQSNPWRQPEAGGGWQRVH